MSLPSEDLYGAADELLAACVTALADSLSGPPDYQAVWTGPPSFDCPEALYVTLGTISLVDTIPTGPQLQLLERMVTTAEVNLTGFAITITRCVPGIEDDGQNVSLPGADEVNDSSRLLYSDYWAIWNGLKNQHIAGTLFGTPSRRRGFALAQGIPLNNQGGVGGWIINVGVEVPGYSA